MIYVIVVHEWICSCTYIYLNIQYVSYIFSPFLVFCLLFISSISFCLFLFYDSLLCSMVQSVGPSSYQRGSLPQMFLIEKLITVAILNMTACYIEYDIGSLLKALDKCSGISQEKISASLYCWPEHIYIIYV